jgi:5-methylcytosine-specific restriction endonuclease McrA/shikimate kinase
LPKSPPKPCAHPGCRQLVSGSTYCTSHERVQRRARQETPRGNRHQRGYTNTWVRASKAFLAKYPLCRRCSEKGVVQVAQVTDHISPHKGDMALFWDETNWQPLCKRCHDFKTAREDGPAQVRPEWLKKPGGRVHLICGPPGSGKSTFVNERADVKDVVIDLDGVISEISGRPIYQAGAEWLARGIRERNRRLAALHRQPADRVAWIIVTGSADWRHWWIEKLQPVETVVLRTPEHICCHRIRSDPRRSLVADRQCKAAARWWSLELSADEMRVRAALGEGESDL